MHTLISSPPVAFQSQATLLTTTIAPTVNPQEKITPTAVCDKLPTSQPTFPAALAAEGTRGRIVFTCTARKIQPALLDER